MSFTTRKDGDIVVVDVAQQVVAANAAELEATVLRELQAGERHFRLDFARAVYVDSAGFGVLVSLAKHMREHGGELRVANLNEDLRTLFKLTKLDQLMRLEDGGDGPASAGVPAPVQPPPRVEGAEERTNELEGAGKTEPTQAWITFGPLPLDGRLPGTEGKPELQARLAESARQQRDPKWQARMAAWRASMDRGEPAAALVAGPLVHGADALVIRDSAASEPRLIVLAEDACSFACITLARHGLTRSEMGTPDVRGRLEIALWLDGRVRIEHADGRVREWTRVWRYLGGEQPKRQREFLARFDHAAQVELPGLGPARVAPSYRYPQGP